MRSVACSILALALGVTGADASRRSVRTIEHVRTTPADTLAVVPFVDVTRRDTDVEPDAEPISRAFRDALRESSSGHPVGVQPETVTVEKLHAAGWRNVARVRLEDSTLCRIAGTRLVMVGMISSYGQGSARSLAQSALTAGMVPPRANAAQLQIDLAIYDVRSGTRVWTYHEEGIRKHLVSPEALARFVRTRIVRRLPFDRR